MLTNPIIEAMMNRKSIRKYKKKMPTNKIIETIVRAGQQAPFASQLGSLLLTKNNPKAPFGAPLSFIFLLDSYKLELIMKRRQWKMITNDLQMLIFGIQDLTLMGENMVMTAESLGLGSCYIGMTPYSAKYLARKHKLPKRVFPIVELVMGYPDEIRPPRPRYPLDAVLFENEYPKFTDEMLDRAMKAMDDGYLAQDYYRNLKAKIKLAGDREETFNYDNYSWTEHISRKWGQWFESPDKLLEQFKQCGFNLKFEE
ncbi:MAG: nitroreductase family protein [Candidatus Zixiibacteriota bacterium]